MNRINKNYFYGLLLVAQWGFGLYVAEQPPIEQVSPRVAFTRQDMLRTLALHNAMNKEEGVPVLARYGYSVLKSRADVSFEDRLLFQEAEAKGEFAREKMNGELDRLKQRLQKAQREGFLLTLSDLSAVRGLDFGRVKFLQAVYDVSDYISLLYSNYQFDPAQEELTQEALRLQKKRIRDFMQDVFVPLQEKLDRWEIERDKKFKAVQDELEEIRDYWMSQGYAGTVPLDQWFEHHLAQLQVPKSWDFQRFGTSDKDIRAKMMEDILPSKHWSVRELSAADKKKQAAMLQDLQRVRELQKIIEE